MDYWGMMGTPLAYFILLWKSFITTMSSGISVGVALAFATVTLVVALVLILVRRLFSFKKRRIKHLVRVLKGRRMTADEREAYEKTIMSDMIQDTLDEMFLRGQITAEKRKMWQRMFGQKMDLQDLLKNSEASVKERVKRRLHEEHGIVVELKKEEPEVQEPRLKKYAGGKLFKRSAA